MRKGEKCWCGEDCWDSNDYSWLASNSGWFGDINGCESSVFFIHGKGIREQRRIPYGNYSLTELLALLPKWMDGLPNARLRWLFDTGDGECGLWIEGERKPNQDDVKRLEDVRIRMKEKAKRDLDYILLRYPDLMK